jgi:hypothetical protein
MLFGNSIKFTGPISGIDSLRENRNSPSGATLCKTRIARKSSSQTHLEKRLLKLEGELRETKNRKTLGFTRFLALNLCLDFFIFYSLAFLKKREVRFDRENARILRRRI